MLDDLLDMVGLESGNAKYGRGYSKGFSDAVKLRDKQWQNACKGEFVLLNRSEFEGYVKECEMMQLELDQLKESLANKPQQGYKPITYNHGNIKPPKKTG